MTEGEATCHYLNQEIFQISISVSRIGFGLPSGGGVTYADEVTLRSALEGENPSFNQKLLEDFVAYVKADFTRLWHQ